MNRINRTLAATMALCCAAGLALPSFASKTSSEKPAAETAYFGSSDISLRGLNIDSFNNKDYPSQQDATAAVMGGEADKIVTFAQEHQFNTLFYEISPRADAMFRSRQLPSSRYLMEEEGKLILADPLKVLLETADMAKINLCVTVSILYAGEVGDTYAQNSPVVLHPDWFVTEGTSLYFDLTKEEVRSFWVDVLTELVERYSLDGIVLRGLDSLGDDEKTVSAVKQMLLACIQAIHLVEPELSAGVALSYQAAESKNWQKCITQLGDSINFIMPEMEISLSSEKAYDDYLKEWNALTENSSVCLYTENQASLLLYPLASDLMFGDPRELSYQLYGNQVSGASGYTICSYSDLKDLRSFIAEEIALVPDSASSADSSLLYEEEATLSIAPASSLIYTKHTSYFLSGRCDPEKPLYVNDEPVDPDQITKDGFWGVNLNLKRGTNVISVRQGYSRKSFTIYSSIRELETEETIDDILETSVYPQENEILYEGQPLVLSCIAPYGGSVIARFQNQTYHLEAEGEYTEEDIGKPIKYSLEIYPENVDSAKTTNLGKVSYVLTYSDFTSKYRSNGQIYLVGSGSRLAVKVEDSVCRVYQSKDESAVISILPVGACDYAADLEGDYYRLYSGGYVRKKDMSIVESFVDIQKSVEAVGIQSTGQGENLIFVGGEGLPYYTSYSEHSGTLTFQLSNVAAMPASLSHLSSRLFDSITVQNDESRGVCTIRLHLKEGETLWGYQVMYQNGNLYLKCKTPPQLSDDPKAPLSGITVIIDPAHGGVDTGSLGALGLEGPTEKDITLAYAQTLRRRLESLGAEVFLTRSDDSAMDGEDRILFCSYKDADFYLSFRLDATDSQYNGWSEEGLSVYYDSEISHAFGGLLYEHLSAGLGIPQNAFNSTDLSILKVPLARALSICPGCISNPSDYERVTDPVQIYKTACLLSDAMIEYLNED